MATIDSVKLYMSRAANRTGWNLLCSIRAAAAYTSNPGVSELLGSSDAVLVDDVPLHGSQDWVTFTFSTPVIISSTGFYSIQVWSSQSDYQHAGVYIYDSDDWVDASGGVPLSGDERGWRYDPTGHSWGSGNTPAYQVICTDSDGNDALTPAATYNTLGGYYATDLGCTGVRSYLEIIVLPSKPTTPTPTNNDTEVDFSGFVLSWVTGGDTDTYNVWIGPSGSLVEVSHGQVGTNYTTNIDEVPLNQKIYWRVDATNEYDTTTGTTWNFDARPRKVDGATTTPADEATGITLHSTTGSWIAPSANTTSYRALYGTLSGFLEEVGTTSDLSMVLVDDDFSVYGKISYWRIDAVNAFGTTQGDELWFTTMNFGPPLPTGYTLDHSGGEGGVLTGTPTGESGMMTVRRLVAAANDKIWYEDV